MEDRLARAKSINMVSYLSSQGFNPVKEKGDDVSFYSPFRQEGSPSFHVSISTNKWADFGRELQRYDILDFVMEYESCNLPEAIDKLLGGADLGPRHIQKDIDTTIKAIEVLETQDDIDNAALVDYMERERRLPISVVNLYCKQCLFQFDARRYVKYYGVSWLSDNGGTNIRNTWFQGTTKGSGITTIYHENTRKLAIFEAMLDYLSYVVMNGTPPCTVIILNSLVYIPMIIDTLKSAEELHLYLDNDGAADEKVEYIISHGIAFTDHREEYKGYNDINEKLQSQ